MGRGCPGAPPIGVGAPPAGGWRGGASWGRGAGAVAPSSRKFPRHGVGDPPEFSVAVDVAVSVLLGVDEDVPDGDLEPAGVAGGGLLLY